MKRPRHYRSKAIVVALALALPLTGCGKSPEQHFKQAQELLQKSDYKTAVIELKTVLQSQPDNREARLLLGETYLKKEAYPDAESELSKARSLGVPDDRVLPLLAKTYVRVGEPQKALDLDIPKTGLSPASTALLHAARAEAQLSLGKRAEAEQSIGTAQQADPNQPELLLTRAKLALMDKQADQAMALVDTALQRDPKSNEARYLKAALLESESKLDDAIKVYRQILADDQSQFRADLGIAGLQLKKGDMAAADKAIQAAEKVAGKAPMVRYARGSLELQRGNLDKASSAFLDVLRVAPEHLPSMLGYAMASYGQGHYEQSINYAGKVLGAVPDNLAAAKILAGSDLKTGDLKNALDTLKPFLAKYPNDSRLMALAGEVNLQAKNYDQAMAYLDKAAALEPKNAAIRASQARGHLAMGDGNDALADLEQAASLSDKPGQADFALVMVHLSRKEYDQALQAISALEKKLPSNPVTYNLRAAALLGKQDRAGARTALEQALAIQPTFFPAAVNLARLDMAENKPDAARKRFDPILAADKNNVYAMLALADIAAANKQEKDYVAWLEKASKADPKFLPARTGLIRYYLAKKDNAKALTLAKQTADANPENPAALDLLGATQMATGDLNGSVVTYTHITQLAPKSPDAHLSLALAQMANKQFDPARDTLKRALQLKPDFLKAQDALLVLEMADKKPEAALQVAHQMQAQQPNSPMGFDREADIELSQKHYPLAIKAYEQALAKGAGSTELIKLHRALVLSGDTKAADQRLSAWLKQNPKDAIVIGYAAQYYLMGNRDRDAIALYEELLRLVPQDALALNNLANLYQRNKDGRALATAEQAFKLAPEHPGVQDTLGWILVEGGQLPRGLDLLRKAVAQAPKVATIRYHFAVGLARSGDKGQAKTELQQALAIGQPFPESEAAKTLLKSL